MRDDFSKITKEILAKRVSFKCSNPNCKKITIGAHSVDDKIINLGVACHITAAAKGGPRFCEEITQEQRKSIQNGIWLCQNCAKLIDTDINKYSYDELIKWKSLAEKESLSVITSDYTQKNQNSTLFDKRILAYEKLYYEIREVDILLKALIDSKEMSIQEKKDAAFYLGLQIAQFTDDNSFYLQNEITVQCVGTFIGVDDIFSPNSKISKISLDNYNKNIRASQELLKSVNEKGLIDTSQKTALMSRYSELKSEQNDFL
ncbi:hypothetical protein [Dysgonomonas gadei]|uniref:Uncharacterized protein n=1 Tax=Dysgonomonas gadei ATCC BAA-286 TaxID=742766 RepID=F5J2P0_9BACT|nr:hypothetical protein [Dysgonomonas gadei]EGK00083.1 hypothetical protein HMPREF9455_03607 [Dysgonomonas gadei ATCC BAA-286]